MIKVIKKMLKSKKSPLMIINEKANDKTMIRELGGNYCQD